MAGLWTPPNTSFSGGLTYHLSANDLNAINNNIAYLWSDERVLQSVDFQGTNYGAVAAGTSKTINTISLTMKEANSYLRYTIHNFDGFASAANTVAKLFINIGDGAIQVGQFWFNDVSVHHAFGGRGTHTAADLAAGQGVSCQLSLSATTGSVSGDANSWISWTVQEVKLASH